MVAIQRDGLVVQQVQDEVLVFNPDRNEASALNRAAAVVFDLCDGEHDIDSMRAALDEAGLGSSSDDAVWLALDELNEAGLIDLQIPKANHLGRRELLKTIGVGAAAAAVVLPVVETIGAPPASAQGSGDNTPAPTVAPTQQPGEGTTIIPNRTTDLPSTFAPTAFPTVAPTSFPTPAPSLP